MKPLVVDLMERLGAAKAGSQLGSGLRFSCKNSSSGDLCNAEKAIRLGYKNF